MNRKELITKISEESGLTQKDCEVALKAFMDSVTKALTDGEKVQLTGFGTFEPRESAERMGHNPSTGEKITIPARISPKFKAGKKLKDMVNNNK